jgi:hypothetical protein
MRTFKTFIENPVLDDLFNAKAPPRKELQRQTKAEPVTVLCYRGFPERGFQRDLIASTGDSYTLSPHNAMEGILWFTNNLQRGGMIDPVEYASSHAHGGYLLTYPLHATKHYIDVQYEPHPDYWNPSDSQPPPEFTCKIDSTDKCRFRQLYGSIYELPEGWFFTWQIEKHIGTSNNVEIKTHMLQRI